MVIFPLGFAATQRRFEVPSEEPVLIHVGQEGGTLVIGYADPPKQLTPPVRGPSPLKIGTSLLHNGFAGSGLFLQEWARLNKVPSYPNELILPMFEPGSYTACFGVDLYPALSRGLQPPPGAVRQRCVSGDLAPYRELYLEIPRVAMDAAIAADGSP